MRSLQLQQQVSPGPPSPLLEYGAPYKEKLIRGAELRDRVLWLIHLRWLAVLGLTFGLPLGQLVLGISLLRLELIVLTLTLAVYNALIHLHVRRLPDDTSDRHLNYIANLQISIDLFMLTLFLYYSGGIQNPFVTYYVFHMIIAAILLTARAAYLQAGWASLLIGLEIGLKYVHVLPHHQLVNFLPLSLYDNRLYVLTFYLVLVSVLFLSVYMTYSISRELRDREERLMAANQMLEEKDRLKSQYVMMISHDLQQPLVAIQSNLRVILDGYAGEVDAQTRELLLRSERRADQLIALIRDLLNLSRMKSYREVPKEVFNLRPMVVNLVNQMEPLAKRKNLSLRLSLPPGKIFVHGNRDALRQMFLNLIDNAIKYTGEGGTVAVRLHPEGDRLRGEVEDTGIGIPPEDIDSVFDEFYRSNRATAHDKEGTGLGLSVVKFAIQAHGGDIQVISPAFKTEDGQGVGTRFVFQIPLHLPEKEAAMDGKRILIIEDDEDIVNAMRMVLEKNGYQVSMAASGEAGLAAIKETPPDLIILDVMMNTQTEGFHVAYKLRSTDPNSEFARYRNIPILMITSIHETTPARFDDATGTEWLPVDEFMEKPVQPEQLLSTVRRMLQP